MIVCGTYGSKRKSCKNCNNFMLWGVTYGHCFVHGEDFPAQHACDNFKKYKPYRYLKQVLINDIVYCIDCYTHEKKTYYLVLVNGEDINTRDVESECFYTLRDVMNAIKKDAFK